MPRNLLAAVMMSALLAMLLSFLPSIRSNDPNAVPTFRQNQPLVLTKQNVVDLFTFLPTHYNIKRVKWEDQSIYVDLIVSENQPALLEQAYRDFYLLVYQALALTKNVQQLKFRLMEEPVDQPSKLLVAISAKRPLQESEPIDPNDLSAIKRYVESSFQVRIDPFFHENISP
ncbi:hypothetical protein ACTID9_13470 [Brevibacillus fluminis]|uniref:hypothetical protein n=1 Tax=Brevibacillus fluminis TaxID=511487 RepID=UPI003F8AEDB6